MRHASGHNYRNSSFIGDVAMGQIPRSTERISSINLNLDLHGSAKRLTHGVMAITGVLSARMCMYITSVVEDADRTHNTITNVTYNPAQTHNILYPC